MRKQRNSISHSVLLPGNGPRSEIVPLCKGLTFSLLFALGVLRFLNEEYSGGC